MRPLKILISAYACSPYKGSEPGVGWNFVKKASKFHVLHVLTEEREFREDIERYLHENPNFENVTFHFIPREIESLSRFFSPIFYFFYNKWQKKAFKIAKELEEKENFDIVHQLNFVGYREPGYLWKINKPFVWGPIGGMDNTAFKLLFNLDYKRFLYYFSRNIINRLQALLLFRPKKAARRERNHLISATIKNKECILRFWGKESTIIPEVGQELSVEKIFVPQRMFNEPLKIVWSGEHTGGKALNILLKSLSKLPLSYNWQLTVLGHGVMTSNWKNLTKRLNFENRIYWTGWLPKEKAHKIMIDSHLMCITSLKDLTSTVLLEALSFGLPVICIDHCGFSNVINKDCGIKIPIDFPRKLTFSFSKAIEVFYLNEDFRLKLANGAIKRAADFSWSEKIEKLNGIYESLVKET
jgi:glycosyltransferase involved in cell wall biosynthesis